MRIRFGDGEAWVAATLEGPDGPLLVTAGHLVPPGQPEVWVLGPDEEHPARVVWNGLDARCAQDVALVTVPPGVTPPARPVGPLRSRVRVVGHQLHLGRLVGSIRCGSPARPEGYTLRRARPVTRVVVPGDSGRPVLDGSLDQVVALVSGATGVSSLLQPLAPIPDLVSRDLGYSVSWRTSAS